MSADILLDATVGLSPVLAFLAALVYLASYKLVTLRSILALIASGVAVAIVCYFVNGFLLGVTRIELGRYARYVAPLVEELGKALVIVWLIRRDRIGFLIDAAIVGFAVGSGFAIVENLQYQRLIPDADLGTWIVRGFGTAIMHGGATAIFAMLAIGMLERERLTAPAAFVPGFVIAVILHSLFNHMFFSPRFSTLAVLLVLPPVMFAVFRHGERTVGDWLGRGLDADADMIASIESGRFSDSPAGRYLTTLRRKFKGPVVADLLCYLRLASELALRAKGILLMRANGFDIEVDAATRAKVEELAYLKRSIGRTGVLALKPLLHIKSREIWQLSVLED